MAKTSVVILNWNGITWLKMFLEKVIRSTMDSDTDIYVADNGSDDGSAEWISLNCKEVHLIELNKNYGFAEGYNKALEQISSQYYLLLNSDIEVNPGWHKPLIACLENEPEVAACQPKILSYDNKDYFEYAGAAGGFIDRLGYPVCRGRVLSSTEKDIGQYDDECEIFWATGACMAVRAEAWKKCGGFDSLFFAHMEEIDLCWRFHRSGYKVKYIPETAVYHVGGGTLPYTSPFKTYLNFRNNLYLLYKNLPDDRLKASIFHRKILDGIASLFFLLKGQFRSAVSVFKAHLEYYRNLDMLKDRRIFVKELGNEENPDLILNKCIIFEFYIKRNRTYRAITKKTFSQ